MSICAACSVERSSRRVRLRTRRLAQTRERSQFPRSRQEFHPLHKPIARWDQRLVALWPLDGSNTTPSGRHIPTTRDVANNIDEIPGHSPTHLGTSWSRQRVADHRLAVTSNTEDDDCRPPSARKPTRHTQRVKTAFSPSAPSHWSAPSSPGPKRARPPNFASSGVRQRKPIQR